MKQGYVAPEFEVSSYDVEDVITLSVGSGEVDNGEGGWMEI